MKKALTWIAGIASLIFIIDWALLGMKIWNGNYDFLTEATIGTVCFPVALVCIILLKCSKKCPSCGKMLTFEGTYCPHCGKKL